MRTNTLLHLWMMGEKCNTIRQLFAMSFQMHLDVTLNQLAQTQPQPGMKVHMGFDREQNGSLCSVKKKSGPCKGSLDLEKI